MKRYSLALFLLVASVRADTLTLRDGSTVTGSWVGLDARQISFLVNDQIRTYPRADVAKVTFGPIVEVGMTKDQVTAILGDPDVLADTGAKQIYTYKDLKVTFVDGKVTDVR